MKSSGISGYLAIMLIAAGIAGLVNKKKGRTVVMPFTVGAITVAVACVAELTLGLALINTRNIDPYRATYLLTGVAFDGAVALVLATIVAVFDRRRRLSGPGPAG